MPMRKWLKELVDSDAVNHVHDGPELAEVHELLAGSGYLRQVAIVHLLIERVEMAQRAKRYAEECWTAEVTTLQARVLDLEKKLAAAEAAREESKCDRG